MESAYKFAPGLQKMLIFAALFAPGFQIYNYLQRILQLMYILIIYNTCCA